MDAEDDHKERPGKSSSTNKDVEDPTSGKGKIPAVNELDAKEDETVKTDFVADEGAFSEKSPLETNANVSQNAVEPDQVQSEETEKHSISDGYVLQETVSTEATETNEGSEPAGGTVESDTSWESNGFVVVSDRAAEGDGA